MLQILPCKVQVDSQLLHSVSVVGTGEIFPHVLGIQTVPLSTGAVRVQYTFVDEVLEMSSKLLHKAFF